MNRDSPELDSMLIFGTHVFSEKLDFKKLISGYSPISTIDMTTAAPFDGHGRDVRLDGGIC